MTSQETTYAELAQLMLHSNPQVKFGATNAVLSLSEDRELIQYLSAPGCLILRNLLRNFETDNKQLILTALSALLNLSGHDSVVRSLIPLNAIERVVRSLNERQYLIQMHCSLLANLTREEEGVKQALKDPRLFKGVFLKYCADSEEHSDSLGLVVLNLTAEAAIREQLCHLDQISTKSDDLECSTPPPSPTQRCLLLECLARLLTVRRRRLIALRILRNLALDPSCHLAVGISRFAARMGAFLYPIGGEGVLARRSEQAPVEAAESELGLASDIETRVVSAEILFCLTRSEEGRQHMRGQGVYEFVRLWHLKEEDVEIKEKLEMVANLVHLSEEEIVRGQLDPPPFEIETPIIA